MSSGLVASLVPTYWAEVIDSQRIDRINEQIVLPAFTAISGEKKRSILLKAPAQITAKTAANVAAIDLTEYFTFECWIKPNRAANDILPIVIADKQNWSIGIMNDSDGNFFYATILKLPLQFQITTSEVATFYDWSHVALTYSKDDATARLYINGKLVGSVVNTLGGALDSALSAPLVIGGNQSITQAYSGYIDEIRLWNYARTEEQIAYARFAQRSLDPSVDGGLVSYWKFQELSGLIAEDSIEATSADITLSLDASQALTSEDGYPQKYGSSFLIGRAEVNMPGTCSAIVFPLERPEDCNFCLCVSWVDENLIRQRRILWHAPNNAEDIAPTNGDLFVAEYNGETLPEIWEFEAWNIDGDSFIQLLEDYIVCISITTAPITSCDDTKVVADIIVWNFCFAEMFPFTDFPLEFTACQFLQGINPEEPPPVIVPNPMVVEGLITEDEQAFIGTQNLGEVIKPE